ncbi:hypothetical protein GmHk_01G002002 [Glycine max]|nr:hypothetical protein GmHk_01G002002 [Glycine max]
MNQKSASASAPVARVCDLCSSADHHTNLCPYLQQSGVNEQPEAYVANIYNRPPQYNPGWRNHPNLRWTSPPQQQQSALPFQNVAGPSKPYNPRNVSAITLRSDKQFEMPLPVAAPAPEPIKLHSTPEKEDEIVAQKRKLPDHEGANKNFHAGGPSSSSSDLQHPPIPLPFPPRAILNKRMEEVEKEILETFKRVEVNIPLLDAIKQIPRYVKFLKELCTHKRKLKGNEMISMGRNVSALIGKSVPHIPEKCKDPGTFCIPCIIGKNKFENAMLDLGALVSVMPLPIFNSLSLGPLQSTNVAIYLANRRVAYLAGFIEDVLVRVGELIFPADFYVLNMEEGFSHGSVPIILGRPFMKIA